MGFFADYLSRSRQRAAGAQIPPSGSKTPAQSTRQGRDAGKDGQPGFCILSKIVSLCQWKLFDLLSGGLKQQKLDHFSACSTSAQLMLPVLSGFLCKGIANQAEKLLNFLFNWKCLKSHKSRAENSKSMRWCLMLSWWKMGAVNKENNHQTSSSWITYIHLQCLLCLWVKGLMMVN